MRIHWPVRTWLLALVLVIVLPLLGLDAYHIYVHTADNVRQAQTSVLSIAQLIAANTHQFLRDSQSLMTRIARRPLIRAVDPARCDPFLDDFRQIYPLYANIVVVARSGQLVCSAVSPESAGQPMSLAGAPWFSTAAQADQFGVGDPWFSPITQKWVALLTYPLHDDQGQVNGVLGVAIDLTRYWNTFDGITLPRGSVITIVDAGGTVVTRSVEPERWIGQSITLIPEGTSRGTGVDGVERNFGVAAIADTSWRVYVGTPWAIIEDAIRQEVVQDAGLALAVILFVMLLAFQIGRRIERPLRSVAQAARAVAQGNLEARAPADGTTETALVALQLNEMLDIRLQAEQEERRLNRALRMLSNCNQAIVRVTDETALLHDVCRIVVETGGYVMAWVGLVESDANKTVTPVAYEGHDSGYLQQIHLTWADQGSGLGATGTAIRTGQPAINRDTRTNPNYHPWRGDLLERGYLSSIALPLPVDGIVVGVLNIYASTIDAFGSQEVTLLTELSGDLAFGLKILREQAERQQAQAALLESEGKFHQLVEQSVEGISLVDQEGIIVEWNQSLERMTGLKRDMVIGKPVWDILIQLHVDEMAPTMRDQLKSAVLESLQAGKAPWLGGSQEYPFRPVEGTSRTIQTTTFAIQTAKGFMLGVVARDITERKVTEDTMLWLASFPEMNSNPVLEVDLAGHLKYANPASRSLLAAMTGDSPEILRTDISAAEIDALQHEETNPLAREVRIGDTWYQQVLHYLPEGHSIRVYVMDITPRKQIEMALYDSERRYREIVETVQEGIWIQTTDGKITFANRQITAMLGYTAEELRGRTIYDLIADETGRNRAQQGLERRKQGLTGRGEFQFRRKDGSILWAFSAANPLYDANGEFKGSLSTLVDITERKSAEEHLRTLSYAIEQSANSVVITDPQANIEYVNPKFTEITGYSLAEVSGQNPRLLKSGQTPPEVYTTMWTTIAAGGEWRGELLNRKKNGELFWESTAISAIRDAEGHIIHFLAVEEDVTERRQTDQALLQYAQRLELLRRIDQGVLSAQSVEDIARAVLPYIRLLVDASRVSIAFLDPVTHQSRVMVVDVDILTQIKPGTNEPLDFAHSSDLEQGKLVYVEDVLLVDHPPQTLQILIAEGLRAIVHVPLMPQGMWIGVLNLGSDHPNAFSAEHLAIAREVADQLAIVMRQAQLHVQIEQYAAELEQRVTMRTTELYQAKEHVEAILNNSSDAIIVIRVDGLISQTNPAFSQLFGYPSPEIEGKPVTMLVDPNTEDDLLPAVRAVIVDQQSRRVETLAIRQNGSTFNADVALSAISDPAGQTASLVASVRDITVRKQLETDLQELNRLKTEFLSTAAHELRTPLTSIQGFSELLVSRDLGIERQQRYLTLINEQSTRLRQIIDDLLDISRLEAKRNLALKLEPIDMAKLLDEVLRPFMESVSARRIINLDLQVCPLVTGDRFRLAQVVNNLLSNAVKYSQDGSMIRVSCRAMADWVEVCVQDQGIGMSPEQMGHLFEQFYRANASATSGTGLGLTICKTIIELHNGIIWAESDYGRGSAFYYRLPASK